MRRSFKQRTAVYSLLVITISGVLTFFIYKHLSEPPTDTHTVDEAIVTSLSAPSTTPIRSSAFVSTAKDDEPEFIQLPSLGVEGFIQKTGQTKQGEIAVPDNIHVAGWYAKSAKPGKPGLAIIGGHVNGLADTALFTELHQLKQSDLFTIKLADGTVLTYKVQSLRTVAAGEATTYLFSQNPGVKSQLNLITCQGTYDSKTNNYDKRLIITTQLQ